jgi:hypothetical protein
MEIKRSGSQPSGKGPAEWFTGTVRVDQLFNPPSRACFLRCRYFRTWCPYGMA